MKEHCFFLEIGFTPRDRDLAEKAGILKQEFERLLCEATDLANGNVSRDLIDSHQAVTRFTLQAEKLTNFYTGIPFNFELTRREEDLHPVCSMPCDKLEDAVEKLNRKAFKLTGELAAFKENLLQCVRNCRVFTLNYPLLIEHILREARHFMQMLAMLCRRMDISGPREIICQVLFWNRQMAEHAKFIAGLLDPSEEALIKAARMFGKEFDELTEEAERAAKCTMDIAGVTAESREATERLRDFKATGTRGLLDCRIESIIIPLLGDHVLREANHFLCIMGKCCN